MNMANYKMKEKKIKMQNGGMFSEEKQKKNQRPTEHISNEKTMGGY
jgi:hypothetical protein